MVEDNKILQVLLGLTQKARKEGTELPILVTRDIQLRVKCNVLGLHSEDRRKGGLPKKTRELYRGIREIRVPWSVVQIINENPTKTELNLNALCLMDNQPEMYPNEFATFVAPDGTSLSQILYRHTGDISTPVVLPKMHKINPRNLEQKATLDLLLDPKVKLVTILGRAGSGKSLIALAAGLEQVLDKRVYKNLFVCRPIQPLGRDIGYLPGSKSEKLDPWLAPVKDNLKFLLSNDSGKFDTKRSRTGKGSSKDEGGFAKSPEFSTFDMLVEQGIIEIEAMTYIRGRSIANSYMLIDECFPYKQKVITSEGKMSIGKLVDLHRTGKVGPLIKTFNEKTKSFEYKKMTNGWNRGRRECIKIIASKQSITTTEKPQVLDVRWMEDGC
jgi:PhoH-like ATPase